MFHAARRRAPGTVCRRAPSPPSPRARRLRRGTDLRPRAAPGFPRARRPHVPRADRPRIGPCARRAGRGVLDVRSLRRARGVAGKPPRPSCPIRQTPVIRAARRALEASVLVGDDGVSEGRRLGPSASQKRSRRLLGRGLAGAGQPPLRRLDRAARSRPARGRALRIRRSGSERYARAPRPFQKPGRLSRRDARSRGRPRSGHARRGVYQRCCRCSTGFPVTGLTFR